jgi:DNA-binding transcriptional regulator YdaS (Cro superfamily)
MAKLDPIKAKDQAVKNAGGCTALAKLIRTSRQAVAKWRKVPPARVLQVEAISGVPRHKLRPDLYPDPAVEARQ